MAATGLAPVERVDAHELAELEEVGDPAGLLQRLVHAVGRTEHLHVAREVVAQATDQVDRLAQAVLGPLHSAVLPHDVAELAVVGVDAACAVDRHEVVDPALHGLLCLDDSGVGLGNLVERTICEVVPDRVRQHEVAVCQALHQGRGTEAVGAVVGEVRLTGHEQPGNRGLQVVVDPQATHHVVHGGVDPHRHHVGVLTGDPGVHVEQVAVLLLDRIPAEPLDRFREVEVDTAAYAFHLGADSAPLVAHVLGLPRRDVTRDQVAERRVDPLQVVVAVLLGDVPWVLGAVASALRHPDAAVVAERLTHQGQLRLVMAGDRDAGGVDLGVAGVGHVGALAVGPPGRGDVAAHRVGGQEEHVSIATTGESTTSAK